MFKCKPRPFDHLAPAQTGEPVSLDAARAAFDADIPSEHAPAWLRDHGYTDDLPRFANLRDGGNLPPEPRDGRGLAWAIIGSAVFWTALGWWVWS